MLKKTKVVIIGAGAAGLMSAIQASNNKNNDVIVIEKNDIVGKKLLITGKGRCNVTNYCDSGDFIKSVVSNSKFMYSAISAFSCYDTYNFFEKLGVQLNIERGNRVFPKSNKSNDIVQALYNKLVDNNVKIMNGEIKELIVEDKQIKGIILNDKEEILCDKVIVATGGKSYPKTGSTGSGYILAQQAGHKIIEPRASLVPLVSSDKTCKKLQGLSLKNVAIKIIDENKNEIYKDFGEMLFTHFGVSGPMILSASSHIKDMKGKQYTLIIDLKPALTKEKLSNRLVREFNDFNNKNFVNSLHKLLPNKLIPVIIKRTNISRDKKCNSITKEEREKIVDILKNFTISIDDFRPIEEAIITRGGVDTKEISPKTMESNLVKGLYFAGEVLDVDAYTGGFNLQIAFSTGYVAGKNI